MRVRDDFRSLTGAERAAVLILSLGEEHAARLFALMDDEEIKELVADDGQPRHGELFGDRRLFIDFADQISATGSLVRHLRLDGRSAHQGPRGEPRRADHGGDPRARRSHDVDKLGNVNETSSPTT